VGALLNKKDEMPDPAKTDGAKQKGAAPDAPGGTKQPAQDPATLALEDAIGGSTLASLAAGETAATATDATTGDGIATIPSDQALLNSKLVTDPLFSDVLGFLVLLQLIPDESLLGLVEKRFSNLDKS